MAQVQVGVYSARPESVGGAGEGTCTLGTSPARQLFPPKSAGVCFGAGWRWAWLWPGCAGGDGGGVGGGRRPVRLYWLYGGIVLF